MHTGGMTQALSDTFRKLPRRGFLFFSSGVFALCAFFSFSSQIFAATHSFTTSSDWNAGVISGAEIESKEGDIQIEGDGTWGARSWKTPQATLSLGSTYASDGTDVFAVRGLGDVLFWKYSPSKDTWSDLTNLPFGTYYGADMVVLGDSIYMIFGGYQTAFARYSITNDSWEMLTDVPDLVYEGGTLTTDGTDIYALRGNLSQDFYKYDVSEGTWSPLTGTPAAIRRGADLTYVSGYLYTPRGYNVTTFYRYDISANTWSTMSNAPAALYDENDITTDGTDIYVSQQNGGTGFYKYDVSANSWSTLTAAPASTRYAGLAYNSGDGYVYFFRGNGQYDFWKYDPTSDTFLGPVDAPATLGTGSDLVYSGGYLYAPRGASTSMYRYSISGNSWSTLTSAPASIADDTKGVAAGSYLYFYRGSNTSTFYRYDPAGNSWSEMATTPATARYGGSLAYTGSGDYVYGTRGASTLSFWRYSISGNSWDDAAVADLPADAEAGYGSRMVSDGTYLYYIAGMGISRMYRYDISGNSWSEMASLPFAPYYGTDISYQNGKILAVSGYYKTDFWEYAIATNTWRRLKDIAGYGPTEIGPYNGASLEYDGSGSFYLTPGTSRATMSVYTPGSDSYPASATWVSPAIDLTYVSSWGSLTDDTTTPDDSSLSYQTRSSADNVSWTSWQSVSGGSIASTAQRYVQIKATFNASTDLDDTPVLHSLTFNYNADTTAPTNPTTFSGSSQEVGGDALVSGTTYRHTHPYFSWSGAIDAETSVAGYYVYFGTNASADPAVDGQYQTAADYSTSSSLSTGSYYLRLKTKDSGGNVSASTQGFVYVYGGISPASSLTVDETTEFLGTATDTNVSGDEIKLSGKAGFWLENRISLAPASIQYGAKNVAYSATENKLYVFRGNNSTTFYEYDVSTDTWSTKAAAPAAVRMGGGVVEGPEGYLYGMRGNNTASFWRYNISTNTWSDSDAADAPLTVYYGGSMVYDQNQYIYVMRGNNDDAFWRYDTQTNLWESVASLDFGATTDAVNNSAYVSADLAMDTENGIVYATQGNYRDGFSAYETSSDSWTVLPDLPALPYLGSSIEYDSLNNAVYYMPGYYTDSLFKYDTSTETWSQVSSAPNTFYYGASIRKAGDYFYALRGNNSTSFYKYDIAKDSWLTPTRGLFGTEFRGTSTLSAYYGADILKGDGDNFYLTRGYYADDFVRYDSSTGTITRLTNTPSGAYNGASMVYESVNNKIYFIPGVYLQKLYSYDIDTNVWTEETADPPPANVDYGSSMVFDGTRYIYMNRGANSSSFYRFDTQGSSGSKWTSMANATAGLGYGAELALYNGYIYTLRGQNVANNPLYRYDISGNSWSTMSNLSIDVYNDGFLANGNNGYLYAARGENDTEFYRYDISGDSWSSLVDVPANVNEGGSGESDGDNKIFVLPGLGSNTYSDGLYTYITQTDTSSFEESGSYVSDVHDFTSVYKWANLVVTYQSVSGSTLTIETRSSADNSTWTSWTAVSEEKQYDSTYHYLINSPANRYLQVRFSLASANGISSGVVDGYTVHYYQDTSAPVNPGDGGLSVYSDNTPGDAIVSETWYGHSAPYFDWPEAEETNGASDTSTGSGIAGYYVYFGTDETADPETSGTYQTATNYTASSLTDGEAYYFRVKTLDNAGNVASTIWAPFIYKYDSVGTSAPADLTADPSGYSSVSSFDFSWSAATGSGALVSQYCYKTGASSGIYASDQCVSGTSASSIPSYRAGSNTFQVRSKDEAGNYSSYASVSYFYADIENAPAPPTNLTVEPSTSTTNAFSFDWDPPLTGTYFGSEANLSYYYSVNALPTAYSTTSTSTTSLGSGPFATLPGENILYVATKDEAGNIDYTNYVSVSFTANTTAPGIPLNVDIADVSVKSTSSWKLALSWEEPTSTGAGVDHYTIYRSLDGETFSQYATSGGISYVDVGLTQQVYYYKVKACDSTNNCGAFSEMVSLYPDGKFTDAASLISDPVVSGVTTKKATVTWATGRTADSKISYGTSSGNYFDEEVSNSEHVSSHSIALTSLSPGTTYYFVAKWTDEDGNTGYSEESTFETDPPPSTEEPVVKNIGLDSALIEFTSKNAASVKIYYGESSSFGGVKDVTTGSGEGTHTVELADLKDGTKYYFKINSFDVEKEEYEGEIHSFETLPRPKVEKIKISQVKGTAKSTLLLSWESNTEISSIVTYYPINSPGSALDEVNIALKKGKHQMILYNLEPQTTYAMIIKGKDVAGNEATSAVQQITTSADTRPPQITDLKIESEIIGTGNEASAQIVISYKTDEPSTSQVEYGEGSGTTYSQKTQEDITLTNHHLIVISELVPSKVYHLRSLSKDTAGNLAESIDKVVITPKATENALDLVITSMSSVFSFLGDIQQ